MIHTVDLKEIQHFSKDSAQWWDENGPFKPLHRLNPVRIGYIKAQILKHFATLEGLKILDVGCGGGLVCEPLTRLGAHITGIDADPVAIETAQSHAAESGLSIPYIHGAVEDLTETYDIVLALEIVEHVADIRTFVQAIANRLNPNGLAIFSTLNRTPKSFALGIVAAEYILRWVPRRTHSWKKFITPAELSRMCRTSALSPIDITGLMFNPCTGDFTLSKRDIAVNYFLSAKNQRA